MTNIEAALGLAQLVRLDEFLAKKKRFNEIYRQELGPIEQVCFQQGHKDTQGSYWLTSVIFKEDVDIISLQQALRNAGIPTRRIFMPVVEFPPYRAYKESDYSNSYHIYNRGLSLPSSTLNEEDGIYEVCRAIKKEL